MDEYNIAWCRNLDAITVIGWAVKQVEGQVKWFNISKGYGFIGRDNGPDVFVHYSGVVGEGFRKLHEGDRVQFDIVDGPKGPQAENVVPMMPAE